MTSTSPRLPAACGGTDDDDDDDDDLTDIFDIFVDARETVDDTDDPFESSENERRIDAIHLKRDVLDLLSERVAEIPGLRRRQTQLLNEVALLRFQLAELLPLISQQQQPKQQQPKQQQQQPKQQQQQPKQQQQQ